VSLRFTPEALQGLEDIDAWLSDRSPQGLRNVLDALKQTFLLIERNPGVGKPARRERVRTFVEPRYRYLVPYYLKGEDVWILRVYHSRRSPLQLDEMRLPSD
jgi:toxin ParE1/3/4